jgi:VWFA-related protein
MTATTKGLGTLSIFIILLILVTGCGGGGGGSSSPVVVPLPTDADLSLEKSIDISTPDVGEKVVFTLTVSNAGPADASGVVVTDQLPAGFSRVDDDSDGAYIPDTGLWNVGSIPVSGSKQLNITATVTPTGPYTNIAQVTAANQPDPDSEPNNDIPSEDDFAGVSAPPPAIKVSINQIETDCSGTVPVVRAIVTVIDQNGVPITNLTDANFEVIEGGTPPASFSVGPVTNPVSVALTMDYSPSITLNPALVTEMEDSAIAFVNNIDASDQGEIIKFNDKANVIWEFTSNKTDLINAIQKTYGGNFGTALYDALYLAIDETSADPSGNRKAVIVIADGEDNVSTKSLNDVIERANAKNIPIFTIGLGILVGQTELEQIADETGGAYYQPATADNLTDVYLQLAQVFANQYVITYDSAYGSGTVTDLEVVVNFNGLTGSDSQNFTVCP